MPQDKPFAGLATQGPPEVLARGGFLTLARQNVRSRFDDGSLGPAYAVESVHPPFLDAVVLLLFARDPATPGGALVALRRGARPVVALRSQDERLAGLDDAPFSGAFWELPAGGVEPADLAPGGPGLAGRASQEAWEEAGLRVPAASFFGLGPSPFFAPAFCPERLRYLAAEVDPGQAAPPPGDGHPMEEGAQARFLGLEEALSWCAQGVILDGKTELGLWRFRDWLSRSGQD